jgi:glycosyltransferase involved in cell wall biosynthesis
MEYKRNIEDILREHPEIKVAHVHLNSCSSIEALEAAKKVGMHCIAHSHSSNSNFNKLTKTLHTINKKRINKLADVRLACSDAAGHFIFGNSDFEIIKNGIDTEKFSFNRAYRDEIRREFDIGDRFTLCHVGMFAPVKNHEFLIDIFASVVKKHPDSVLLLVGTGSETEKIREKVSGLGLSKKVIFAGRRTDVEKIMSAADAFVLPSHFEGLPLVLVEAQSSGLNCFVSDAVPEEAKLLDNFEFIPLDIGAEAWADRILSAALNTDRASASAVVAAAGYDCKLTAARIEKIYSQQIALCL